MKILVAEDEPKVRRFVKQALEEAGMVVDTVATEEELLTSLKTSSYDVVILDRLLHGRDLLNRISTIRVSSPQTKILVLSALSQVEDKVKGLTEGADDYLGKPFHVSELIARIRSLLRRKSQTISGEKDTLILFGDLKIDLETQKVIRGEKKIDLTGKEFRLLCLLARQPGKVFSRMDLLDRLWDLNHFPESNVVEVTVAGLRSRLDRGQSPLIHSRRGVGYWLGEP